MGVAVSGHCFDIYIVASVGRRPQYIPSLTNWSWDMYRSDDGFHIYLGCIGILAGITEFLIVRKYMEN